MKGFPARREKILSLTDRWSSPLLKIHSFGLSLNHDRLRIFIALGYYSENGLIALRILSTLPVSWKTKIPPIVLLHCPCSFVKDELTLLWGIYFQAPYSVPLIFVFWTLSQFFQFPLSPSLRDSLVPLCFLLLKWYYLYIWGCWSWFQLVIHWAWPFTSCTVRRN